MSDSERGSGDRNVTVVADRRPDGPRDGSDGLIDTSVIADGLENRVVTINPETGRPEKAHLKYYDFEQGSAEWLECRNQFITASAISQVLKGPRYSEYRNLLQEKASYGQIRSFFGSKATRWGHKYEPVANMVFCHYHPGHEVYEYGVVANDKYPHLGVSPDGITNKGEMVEIKCPFSRKINGVIKPEYRHQIQQQLLVCEYDICNFVECKFVEVEPNVFWDSPLIKGVIVKSLEGDNKYNHYSPIELSHCREDMQEWISYRLEDIEDICGTLLEMTYWVLETYNCQRVQKDPEWYIQHREAIEQFWSDVEREREKISRSSDHHSSPPSSPSTHSTFNNETECLL